MQIVDAVLFSQRVEIISSYQERRDCIDQRLVCFLSECGYLPVGLPNNEELIPDYLRIISPKAIVLSGGNSLEKYGGNAPERDASDKYLIEKSIENNIPLIGICRGMQSILDYFDENLVEVVGHVATRHLIKSNNPKNAFFNREINCYHNQGTYCVTNENLKILAKSDDGVVKAIIHTNKPILGIMWHPEREKTFSSQDVKLFRSFIKNKKIDV